MLARGRAKGLKPSGSLPKDRAEGAPEDRTEGRARGSFTSDRAKGAPDRPPQLGDEGSDLGE